MKKGSELGLGVMGVSVYGAFASEGGLRSSLGSGMPQIRSSTSSIPERTSFLSPELSCLSSSSYPADTCLTLWV